MCNVYYCEKLLETTSDFLFFKDKEGRYQEISNSILKLAVFDKREDIIGKKDEEIYPEDIAQEFIKQDKIVTEEKKSMSFSDWVDHKELGKILIETVKSPIYGDNGEVVGIQGVARDITDKYKAAQIIQKREAEIKAIFRTIPLPMMIKDIQGHYVYFLLIIHYTYLD